MIAYFSKIKIFYENLFVFFQMKEVITSEILFLNCNKILYFTAIAILRFISRKKNVFKKKCLKSFLRLVV